MLPLRWRHLPACLAATLFLLVALAGRVDGQSGPGDAPEHDEADVLAATAPVVVDGVKLLDIRGISSYPAPRRAEVIAERIREVARDSALDTATITIVDGDRQTQIMAGDRQVLAVFNADAALEGIDRQLLAQVYLEKIRETIGGYRAARTRDALLRSAGRAGVATLVAAAALFALRWAFRALRRAIERRYRDRVGRALTIRSFELVRAEHLWAVVNGAVRFIGAASILLVLFLYMRYTLALFPWTRGIAFQIGDWTLAPPRMLASGLVAILPNLFFLTILFLLTRYALRLIRLFCEAVGRGQVKLERFSAEWADPTYKLVRVLVVALAIVIAYPYIPGSSSPAFKGISVFVGVLFSLGSSSAVSNIIAGYLLVYRRTFRAGDMVKIGNSLGLVVQVRLQATHLRTIKNEEIIIPNATIVGTEVVNYSALAQTEGLILHTTVGIGYETPWQQVEAMLLEAASRTPGIRQEPKPFVLQTALGDFAVTHQINVYCDTAGTMSRTYAALHRNILDVFNEHGVQIMTPAYEGDPEQPKVVPPEQWYKAPAVAPPQGAEEAPPPSLAARAAGDSSA